ncbi:MAG: hypothetical protein HRT88_18865, partial [Lentisphaeraceae bacterium]|nr:hypothetical protein [Lentisphaeraceae bacterium]
MKALLAILLIPLICSFTLFSSDPVATKLKGLSLSGSFEQENLVFVLESSFKAGNDKKPFTLITGDIALIETDLGKRGNLKRTGKDLKVIFTKKGDVKFKIKFAIKAQKIKEGLCTSFSLADYQVRPFSFNSGKENIAINFPTLVRIKKAKNNQQEQIYSCFMQLGRQFSMSWKPQLKTLKKELSLTCTMHSVMNLKVGSLQMNSLLKYTTLQGKATQVDIKIPAGMSLTKVSANFLKSWKTVTNEDKSRVLQVSFTKEIQGHFTLSLEAEKALKEFPVDVKVNLLEPLAVLRSNGFVALGTNNAIKLLVKSKNAMTQVEPQSFQYGLRRQFSSFPKGTLFVYNFASLPASLDISLDNIAPIIDADNQLIFHARESDLLLHSRLQVDIRDAAIRQLNIKLPKNLNVSRLRTAEMSGYEIEQLDDAQLLKIHFRQAVIGKRLIDINLEQTVKNWADVKKLPYVKVMGTRTSRGIIALAADKGWLVDLVNDKKLRKIPVASLAMRRNSLQQAWKFK